MKDNSDRIRKGAVLSTCADSLVHYLRLTRRAGPSLDAMEAQAIMDTCLRFLSLHEEAEIPFIPKFHLMVHLAKQSYELGNPVNLATWHDESLNSQPAKIAAAAHPLVFERRVLATFNTSAIVMPASKKQRS